jgi:hypothetical protein
MLFLNRNTIFLALFLIDLILQIFPSCNIFILYYNPDNISCKCYIFSYTYCAKGGIGILKTASTKSTDNDAFRILI